MTVKSSSSLNLTTLSTLERSKLFCFLPWFRRILQWFAWISSFCLHQFLRWESLFGKPVRVSHCTVNMLTFVFFVFMLIEHIRDIVYYLHCSIIIALISHRIICVLIGNWLRHSLLYWSYLDLYNIWNWVNFSISSRKWEKGLLDLESLSDLLSWNEQFTVLDHVYSYRNYKYLFWGSYRKSACSGILIPLLLDLQSRINNIFIHRHLAFYLQ